MRHRRAVPRGRGAEAVTIFICFVRMPASADVRRVGNNVLAAHVLPHLSAHNLAALRAAFKEGNPVQPGAAVKRLEDGVRARQREVQGDMRTFFAFVAAATRYQRRNGTVTSLMSARVDPRRAWDALDANIRRMPRTNWVQVEFTLDTPFEELPVSFVPGKGNAGTKRAAVRRHVKAGMDVGGFDEPFFIVFTARGHGVQYELQLKTDASARWSWEPTLELTVGGLMLHTYLGGSQAPFSVRVVSTPRNTTARGWFKVATEFAAVVRAYSATFAALGEPRWMRIKSRHYSRNRDNNDEALRDAARSLAHLTGMNEGMIYP